MANVVLAQQSSLGEPWMLAAVMIWAAVMLGIAIRLRWWQLPETDATGSAAAREGLMDLLRAMMVWFSAMVGGGIAAGMAVVIANDVSEFEGNASMMSLVVWGQSLGLVVAGLLWFAGHRFAEQRERARDAAVRGLVVFALVMPVSMTAIAIGSWVQTAVTGEPPDVVGHSTLELLLGAWGVSEWLIVIGVVVLVPAFEEIVYRGFVQRGLCRLMASRWLGIGMTTIIFVLMHAGAANASTWGGLAVLSVVLGVLRERTGSVWSCVVAHGVFNAANVAMAAVFV